MHKKQNFIVSFYTSAQWVKPAEPAEPTFLTPALLMGTLPNDAGGAGWLYCKSQFDEFVKTGF